MALTEKQALIMEIKENVIGYLQEELKINADALKAYEERENPVQNSDVEVKKIREIEAVKLRDRIHELSRHIAVIKRMI